MQLTTTTQVSVDGVMEGNGAQDQNRSGFERGGWARPLFDNEAMTFVNQVYQRADAFLFGRRTYETLRRLLGNRLLGGKSGRQPDLNGVEHAAQVRGTDPLHLGC